MQLSELIREYSINTISEKTNITPIKLEQLGNGEFEHFRKVQVLGFISIIEREFGVDLSDFKAEAEQYFSTHDTSVPSSASIYILDGQSAASKQGGFASIVLVLLTIGAIGYGAWFFLNKQQPNGELLNQTAEKNSSKESMFTQAIDGAKNILGDTKNRVTEAKNTKVTQAPKEEKKAETTQKNETNNKKFDISTSQTNNSKPSDDKTIDLTPTASNSKPKSDSVDALVQESSQKSQQQDSGLNHANNSTVESNNSNSDVAKVDTNSDMQNSSTQSNTTDSKDINNTISDKDNSDINDSNIDVNQDTNSTQDSNAAGMLESAKLVLNKSKRIWLGVYNLDTKKRVSTFAKKEYKFDLSKGKLAVVTGHSLFKLVTNNGEKTFGGVKKSYFTISKDEGIKVITKKEYRALTKKRAW